VRTLSSKHVSLLGHILSKKSKIIYQMALLGVFVSDIAAKKLVCLSLTIFFGLIEYLRISLEPT